MLSWITGWVFKFLILQMGHLDSLTLVQSTSHNLSGSAELDLDLLKLWRVSAAAAARDEHASLPVKDMSQQQQSQVWLKYAYHMSVKVTACVAGYE